MKIPEFLAYMKTRRKHKTFYHFSDKQYLPSIRKLGILSRAEIERLGINITACGGDELSLALDRKTGMDEYAHLCFTDWHPLAYKAAITGRIKDLIYLKVDPNVLKEVGVRISDGVAYANGVEPRPAEEMLEEIDYKVIYEWVDDAKARWDIARKYELLIPKRVLPKFVLDDYLQPAIPVKELHG